MEYGFISLFGRSRSHTRTTLWVWCAGEIRFPTHDCYTLCFAQHALTTKTLPPKLAQVLKIIVKCVNYVQNSAMKHRIFKKLCTEMGSLRIRGTSVPFKRSEVIQGKGAESCFCHAC
uniref:Protein ZBED8like [Pundamilia nyererei] n=1 Tax=Lepeophtheirus salmonis TaxID=72036 RepID=A0A0K2UWE1_LEPSM